jgi:DHA3 family macrolide efflux protein-like MFS transporter
VTHVHRPVTTASLGRAFWWIWTTQTLSVVGSTLSAIGVAVSVYLDTGDTRWLGALAAGAAIPALLVTPWLRALDRFSRRSTMLVADAVSATGPVLALVVALTGALHVWHLAVAAVLSGIGTAVQTPALAAAVPTLLPASADPAALARANGLFQLGPALGIVLGPALAAPLVATWGVTSVLVVDVATFVLAAGVTATTRFGGAPGRPVGDDGSWAAAWRFLRGSGRPLLALIGVMGAVNLVLAFFNVSLLALAVDVGGATRAGLPVAAGGLAMIVGSLLAGAARLHGHPVRWLAVGLGAIAAGCVVMSARASLVVVIAGVAVALLPVAVVGASISTVFHTRVPAGMHGRVFAVRSTVARSLDPFGAAVAGVVIAQVASPAMAPGGWAGQRIGPLIGVGPERGPALVLACTGIALAALAAAVATSRTLAPLDAPPHELTIDHASNEPSPTGGRHQPTA